MTTILDKLSERGYWRVELRPVQYQERRVSSLKVLRSAVETSGVELRRWGFPHIDRNWPLPESQVSVGQETNRGVHVEVWKAFLSGQFVYRGGIWTDWLDQDLFGRARTDWVPGQFLPIVSTLWSLSEFFEFAARYAQTPCGADYLHIELTLNGLEGRYLKGDHDRRHWFEDFGPARLKAFSFTRALSRTELISTSSQLALETATELYGLFGWHTGPDFLAPLQEELLTSRTGG